LLRQGATIATRIIVNHDDPAFAEALTDLLRAKGCDVVASADPDAAVPAPRNAGILELTVSQSKRQYPGARIRVTGLPGNSDYAGMFGNFLGEPVTVAGVMAALVRFNV
jgi:hypothetical protein